MIKFYISPQAKSDIEEIKEYITIELDNPIAALNVVSKIMKSMKQLIEFPDMGALLSSVIEIPTNYRFLVSGNYLVFYRHERDSLYVVRVLYGRRDYISILFGELPEE